MVPFKLTVTLMSMLPLEGFFNALVYLRLRHLKYIRPNPDSSISYRLSSLGRKFLSKKNQQPSQDETTNKNVDIAVISAEKTYPVSDDTQEKKSLDLRMIIHDIDIVERMSTHCTGQ